MAAIDGSQLRALPPEGGAALAIAPDRVVYHVHVGEDPLEPHDNLVLWTPAGTRTLLEGATCCNIGYAEDVDAVYAGLFVEPHGVWRVPLDGSPPRQVLPPPPPPPDPYGSVSLHRDPIVASPDGRHIAAGDCSIAYCSYAQIRVPGEDPPWGEAGGYPRGFDNRGRYLSYAGPLGPVRRLVVGGEDEKIAPRNREARVLRRGHVLASSHWPLGRRETTVTLIALDGGRSVSWSLPGRWDLTPFGGQRYVVLEAEVAASPAITGLRVRPGGHLIFDTAEGWLGYLPFRTDGMPPTDAAASSRSDPFVPAMIAAGFAVGFLMWHRRRAATSGRHGERRTFLRSRGV